MLFSFALGIDEDVIKVHYYQNIKLLCQDLADIALKYCRCVGQSKKHYLILKMAIAGPKDRLLFVSFSNLYLIIGIG